MELATINNLQDQRIIHSRRHYEQIKFLECVLPFGLEYSVFPLPIPSVKMKKYRLVGLILLYMISHVKGGSQTEYFQEKGAEEKTFGPKREGVRGHWWTVRKEKLHQSCRSPNIRIIIRIRRWVGHVPRMGVRKCIQGFGWKLKEKYLLGDTGVDGKIFKWNLKKDGRKWIWSVCLGTGTSGGLLFETTVIKFLVSTECGNFLIC